MATTTEITTTDNLPEITGINKLIAALVFIVIATVGILGNSLVILAVVLSRRLQTTTNIYVVALAITDLLIAIIQIVQVATLLSETRSMFLLNVCAGAASLNFTFLGCSVSMLALIAVNRMQVITRTSRPKAKKVVASVIIDYVLNAIGLVAVKFIDGIEFGNVRGFCNYIAGSFTDYAIGVYIFILLIIIIVCYGRTYHYVRLHFRQVAQMKTKVIQNARPHSSLNLRVPNMQPVGKAESTGALAHCDRALQDNVERGRWCITGARPTIAILETPAIVRKQIFASSTSKLTGIADKPRNLSQNTERASLHHIPTVSQVNVLQSRPFLSLVGTENPAYEKGPHPAYPDAAKPSGDFKRENININPQKALSKEKVCKGSINNETLDKSKAVSDVGSFLDRSPSLQIPSKPKDLNRVHGFQLNNNRMKAESRVTLNMLLLVVTFFACMTPTIVQLLVPGQQDSNWVVFLILFSNCCWNPMIYAWKHQEFKHAFGCILSGKISRIRDPVPWLRRRIAAN